MRRKWIGMAVASGLVLLNAQMALASDQDKWLAERQADFAQWQASHPNAEAGIADLKAKTAALVAAYVPPPMPAKYADLRAQSAALSPEKKAMAQQLLTAATTLWQWGEPAAAREGFVLVLMIDPANGPANYYRGEIYLNDNDKNNAALYMDRAATLAPGTAEASKAVAALRGLPPVTNDTTTSLPPAIWRVPGAATEIWDSPEAPQMVVIPAGEYTMEAGGIRNREKIAYPLAVGKFDVTRGEFAQFVAETRYDASSGGCYTNGARFSNNTPDSFNLAPDADWKNPGFNQTDKDPVTCINWQDATAYVTWLSRKTGHNYRLLSESEWEFAARGGTTTPYYWGNDPGKGNANCIGCGTPWDHKGTSPSGSFAPNPFGLYDMGGNLWQWTNDCSNPSLAGAPTDGSPRLTGECGQRMLRGASWYNNPMQVRPSTRYGYYILYRPANWGIRVARTL